MFASLSAPLVRPLECLFPLLGTGCTRHLLQGGVARRGRVPALAIGVQRLPVQPEADEEVKLCLQGCHGWYLKSNCASITKFDRLLE